MSSSPQISVIVPTWNTRDLLAECLESIAQTRHDARAETIVVDNGSSDGTCAMVRAHFPGVRLICNRENIGFGGAVNQGMASSTGRYGLLLNSDARLLPGALGALLEVAEAHTRAGVVGARLLNVDGSFQASFAHFPTFAQEFLVLSGLGRLLYGRCYPRNAGKGKNEPQPVDWVCGACLLVRRSAFDEVGGFDERYFMYVEGVDLCYRMHAVGWQVWYQPAARIRHIGGASSVHRPTHREADLYRSRLRFFHTHYGERAAALLKLELYGFTAVKTVVHGVARLLTGGRCGRQVVSVRELATALRRQ